MPHRIQQFNHEGSVNGVDGKVDLNVFRGTRSEWKSYLSGIKQPNR